MSNFIYTTSNRLPVPLLIDAEALKALDNIIIPTWEQLVGEIDERFHEDLAKSIKDDDLIASYEESLTQDDSLQIRRVEDAELSREVKDELIASAAKSRDKRTAELRESLENRKQTLKERLESYSYFNKYKKEFSLLIGLGENKKIQVESFEKALSNVDLLDETPRTFELEYSVGEHRFSMILDKRSLSYRVSPEHLPTSRDLFAGVEQWARSIAPPFWQRMWLEWGSLSWPLLFLGLMCSAFIVAATSDPATEFYKKQAFEILQNGVSAENQTKAIEALLALTIKYRPQDVPSPSFPIWFWVLNLSATVACILLAFKPASVLGIGKGAAVISQWRGYIRIVFIVVPAFILVNVLVPFLQKWFFGG